MSLKKIKIPLLEGGSKRLNISQIGNRTEYRNTIHVEGTFMSIFKLHFNFTQEMMRQIQCLLSSQDKDDACHLFTEVLDTLGE